MPDALTTELPPIPVLDTGLDFPLTSLRAHEARAHRLLDRATRRVPKAALRSLDAISRRWLARSCPDHLAEIDAVAAVLRRPGAHFLSVSYEWGCTCLAAPSPDGRSARLIRVLDWRTAGLGENVIAVRVQSPPGPFVTLTWPGYTGVLQAMAPRRFSAALNQAPMRSPAGVYAVDWAMNRRRVWTSCASTPSHLLRHVFAAATTFAEAVEMLTATPIAAPCIYIVAGLAPDETAVIERSETAASVARGGSQAAANHWSIAPWPSRARGHDSAGRARRMADVTPHLDASLPWLRAPILNPLTRLVMIGDAASGQVVARGIEREAPATAPLCLSMAD
ncbi:MAG: hypothetical protein NW217_02370 [Hyphomicrobiaceae bacterium]|nr:hypothetical protein [Hyphomicrobiaceae bacterium]